MAIRRQAQNKRTKDSSSSLQHTNTP
uniref:Uncharacterized protein n=1 Tax=Arundo donax TaxID=35708 RepID=A0A0A9ARZ3_ARUDO